jgi:hypothetical protein
MTLRVARVYETTGPGRKQATAIENFDVRISYL